MRQPAVFIPHGGGPSFFFPDGQFPSHGLFKRMEPVIGPKGTQKAFLASLVDSLPERPAAIVVASAHWEADGKVGVNTGAAPDLLYDYYGFPAWSYELEFPAPGQPELAKRVLALLASAGIASVGEAKRGFDHGVFVPLKVVTPQADIPIVEISLKSNLSPAEHIAVGRALRELRDDNVLVIGSGMSSHGFFGGAGTDEQIAAADAFHAALYEAGKEQSTLADFLLRWDEQPGARVTHPREEHLIPLHVVFGASHDDERAAFPFVDKSFIHVCAVAFGL